jgi:hypothetical protein
MVLKNEKMEAIKKETQEVIEEAIKEVTGKSIEEIKVELEEKEKAIDKEFEAELVKLCQKYNRTLGISKPTLIIQRIK